MTLTRSTTRVAVGAAVALLLVLGMVGGITPAFAGHGAGTANVNVHETLAGTQDQAFSITVTHPAGPGTPFPPDPLNPPTAPAALNQILVTSPPGFKIDSAAGPSEGGAPAWDATLLQIGSDIRQVLFTLKEGKAGIAAGGNGAFTFQADVPVPSKELTTTQWEVQVSSDGGESNQLPTGDLSTKVRILKIQNVAITAPAGAVDGTVSGKQGEVRDVDGDTINDEPAVMSRCQVTNHSSAVHLVTPTLSGGGNVTIVNAPAAANVNPGETRAFDFQLSFADVSSNQSTALQCNATSTGGGGTGSTPGAQFNAQTPVTIQPRAVFNYVANVNLPTFSPAALSPNKTVTFRIAVQKTGVPAVNLSAGQTRLGFLTKDESGFAIPKTALSSSPAVPANPQTNFLMEFGPVNIGALEDGRYRGVLDIRGTDANDSAVGFVPLPSFTERLLIDAGIPVLNLGVTPPGLPTSWPSTPDYDYVARADRDGGSAVTFGGSVEDVDPDTGMSGGCGTCTIVPGTAVLKQYTEETGGDIAGPDIPVTLNINTTTGAITGSYNGTYAPTAKSVELQAKVVDTAGNESALTPSTGCGYCPARFSDAEKSLLSGRAVVDNGTPSIVSVRSMRDADGSQDLLLVTLSECAYGVTQTTDWSFPGGSPTQRVVATRPMGGVPNCAVSSPVPLASQGTIILELADALPDDDTAGTPLGQIRYAPVAGANPLSDEDDPTRFMDRTGSTVADVTKSIIDGIAPLNPVIQSIKLGTRDIGLQDGAFWTNIDQPSFLLTDQPGQPQRAVKDGNTARLYQETNGEDGFQESDTQISDDADNVVGGCTADDGNPATPLPPCSILVEANFATSGANNADTSLSEAAHTLYAVMLDQVDPPAPKNLSVATAALVEIDRLKPDVDVSSTQFQASQIEVKFTDSIAFGNNRANDWLIVDDEDRFVGLTSVSNGPSPDRRLLNVGSTHYDPDKVMQFGYRFLGPAGQRYEDRATNTLLNSAVCLKTVAGSTVCPA